MDPEENNSPDKPTLNLLPLVGGPQQNNTGRSMSPPLELPFPLDLTLRVGRSRSPPLGLPFALDLTLRVGQLYHAGDRNPYPSEARRARSSPPSLTWPSFLPAHLQLLYLISPVFSTPRPRPTSHTPRQIPLAPKASRPSDITAWVSTATALIAPVTPKVTVSRISPVPMPSIFSAFSDLQRPSPTPANREPTTSSLQLDKGKGKVQSPDDPSSSQGTMDGHDPSQLASGSGCANPPVSDQTSRSPTAEPIYRRSSARLHAKRQRLIEAHDQHSADVGSPDIEQVNVVPLFVQNEAASLAMDQHGEGDEQVEIGAAAGEGIEGPQEPDNRPVHGRREKSSQYLGVTKYKRTGRWESNIWTGGKQKYLGASSTELAAARAYDRGALHYKRERAVLNFGIDNYASELNQLLEISSEDLLQMLRDQSAGVGQPEPQYPAQLRRLRDLPVNYAAFGRE